MSMPGGLSDEVQESLQTSSVPAAEPLDRQDSAGNSGYATPLETDQPPPSNSQAPVELHQQQSDHPQPDQQPTSEAPKRDIAEPEAAQSDGKSVGEQPVTLKLRASLKKRKSQEAARVQMSQPDPLDLFGQVSLPGCSIGHFPGPTYESAAMTKLVLTENHIKHHIFFNKQGLHNHLAHAVLASYALGASAELIHAIFELQAKMQRPMPPIAVSITEANFNDHLGQDDMYPAYLHFFTREISDKGVLPTVVTWLFDRTEHQLLIRSVSGAIHSFIHIGYGLEFNLPAIVAEGLAQAAVHSAMVAPLFPLHWPSSESVSGRSRSASQSIAGLASRLHLIHPKPESFVATARRLPMERSLEPKEGLQGLTVLCYLFADPDLAPGQTNAFTDGNKLKKTIQTRADSVARWASEWAVETAAGDSFEQCAQAAEEIFFISTMILGATAMRPGFEDTCAPKLDFFLMHAVTSALFLPTYLEVLSPSHRVRVLRAHWNVMIGYWISRGRPELNLKWLMSRTAYPAPPNDPLVSGGVQAELAKNTASEAGDSGKGKQREGAAPQVDPRPASKLAPWPAIIASAVDHPDEHVTKTIRSLAFFSSLFGHAPPARFRSALPDSEIVDGSIFIRTAGVVMDTLGWSHEGQQAKQDWNHSGIGFEECWKPAQPN